jgi:hypothetical protein
VSRTSTPRRFLFLLPSTRGQEPRRAAHRPCAPLPDPLVPPPPSSLQEPYRPHRLLRFPSAARQRVAPSDPTNMASDDPVLAACKVLLFSFRFFPSCIRRTHTVRFASFPPVTYCHSSSHKTPKKFHKLTGSINCFLPKLVMYLRRVRTTAN